MDSDNDLGSEDAESMQIGPCDATDSKQNNDIIQVSTKTTSKRISITWDIDEKSLQMARVHRRNRDLSVITATIIKHGIEFKLECCTIGWKNSQPGYCAWYLTIPNASHYNNGNELVARYRVSVMYILYIYVLYNIIIIIYYVLFTIYIDIHYFNF